MYGYGTSLSVGIGIPIPMLDEEMAFFTSVGDEDILAPIVDYSKTYPRAEPDVLGEVTYAELRSGEIRVGDKGVPTGSISSFLMAREIAQVLKDWVKKGEFLLTEPVTRLPGKEEGVTFKAFKERPV
jgi:uncharacterized protein (DUF39 family)